MIVAPMFPTQWLWRRLLPLLALAAAVGALAGLFRSAMGFLAGIQGIALGLALGYVCGRIGRRDPLRFWSFSQRVWITLDFVVVFASLHLLVLSGQGSGSWANPFEWLSDILGGSRKEAFASLGGTRGARQVVAGALSGGWWIFFSTLDLGLMAALMLAGQAMGLSPGARGAPEPGTPGDGRVRVAALVFPALLVLAGATPWVWTGVAERQDAQDRSEAAARVAGTWEITGWSDVLGDADRRFSLFDPRDGSNDVGGVSRGTKKWVLLLGWTGDGFEGSLVVGDRDPVPVTMKSTSAGALELTTRSPSGEVVRGTAQRTGGQR